MATRSSAAGTGFDPGGIGKGLAADIVIGELLAAGAEGAVREPRWRSPRRRLQPARRGVDDRDRHPSIDEPIALIGLHVGAVATSTTLRRRWTVDGQVRHHLIDPTTGEPSRSDLELITVIAGEAWVAEVMAKAVLLRGIGAGLRHRRRQQGAGADDRCRGCGAHDGGISTLRRQHPVADRHQPTNHGGSVMNEQLWWYVARSGGIVAWALLAASVLWGLALSTKVLARQAEAELDPRSAPLPRRPRVDVHRHPRDRVDARLVRALRAHRGRSSRSPACGIQRRSCGVSSACTC